MITRAKMWLFLGACMSCFYITALIKDYRVSEISCLKTTWYLCVLNTTLHFLNLVNRVGAQIALGDHQVNFRTVLFWHKSKVLCWLFLLIQVVKAICMSILFHKVTTISYSCKKIIHGYALFWHAAELQAVLFIIIFSILTIILLIFSCFVIALRVSDNFTEILDVEDPEPVPINHGIEMSADGESSKPRKPDVKKTEVEGKACSICRENEKTHACIPCGHMCLCALCAEDLSKKGVRGQNITRCPICRQEVDNFSRIFQ